MSSDRNPPAEEDRETGLAVPAGDMSEWAEALVAQARTDGVELTGEGGLLTGLIRQVLQTGLEVEMADHLGYDRYSPEGRGSGNSRNGYSPKRVTTDIGEVDLSVPRDRAGSFEPVTVPKVSAPPRRPVGQRDLALRKGPHDWRYPGSSRRDLRHRHQPRDDQPDYGPDR